MKRPIGLINMSVLLALILVLSPISVLAQGEITCDTDVIVQADDWLSKIADKFYGDPLAFTAIAEATNTIAAVDDSYATIDNVDVIEPGWKLCVPSAEDAEAIVGSIGPFYGGSITSAMGTQGIRGFETWQDTTGNETHVYTALYDTFVRYNDQYQITPGLFESWVTEDAQTWVFNVRQGVMWHDGVELTAQHFIDYFDTVQDPESGAASETIDLYEGATYEALNDYTIQKVLTQPNAALLDGFTAQWLSRTSDFNPTQPVGTGPFKLIEWNRNQSIKFVRNDDYWREGLPYIDELTFVMSPDATTRVNLLLTGEVDVIRAVPLAEVEKLQERNDIQLIKTPDQYQVLEWYMLMKNSEPPFDDKRVRQAINYAIDRQALLDVTFGLGSIKSNPISPGSWAYNPDAPNYDQRDLEQARQLMQEAGYDPNQTNFTVSFKYWQEWPENLQIGQIVQSNLADIGIGVELELLEIGQWVETVLQDHQYELALTALVPRWDPNDQFGNVYRTDDGQALEWENAEFDQLWQAGRATADIDQRREAYFEAQVIAMEEAPAAILNSVPSFDAATPAIRNLIRYNRGDLFYERAWIAE